MSAHYLIAKDGTIFQILDPDRYVAWHAGAVFNVDHGNEFSIGVEVHFTPAEIEWSSAMWAGLTRLARQYSHLAMLTHRGIAKPKGRKIDPSGVTDPQFSSWAVSLQQPHRFAVLGYNSNMRSSPKFENNIVQTLPKNKSVIVNAEPVKGDVYRGNDLWYYCNWSGYIHSSLLEIGGEV